MSLLREFDADFEVLVPFRCHSSGTLVALGARRVILGLLSELSPIDPSTGNQFNPVDPVDKRSRLAIGVEDVTAFRQFIVDQFADKDAGDESSRESTNQALRDAVNRLIHEVHPIALGGVHRVLQQIKKLATELLKLHPFGEADDEIQVIVNKLTLLSAVPRLVFFGLSSPR